MSKFSDTMHAAAVAEEELALWDKGRVTGNSALLAGYIFGSLMRDELYRMVETDPEAGESIIEHRQTKSRFRLRLEQIGGTE